MFSTNYKINSIDDSGPYAVDRTGGFVEIEGTNSYPLVSVIITMPGNTYGVNRIQSGASFTVIQSAPRSREQNLKAKCSCSGPLIKVLP